MGQMPGGHCRHHDDGVRGRLCGQSLAGLECMGLFHVSLSASRSGLPAVFIPVVSPVRPRFFRSKKNGAEVDCQSN